MASIGGEAIGSTPQAFSDLIKSDMKKWGDLIKRAGLVKSQ